MNKQDSPSGAFLVLNLWGLDMLDVFVALNRQ